MNISRLERLTPAILLALLLAACGGSQEAPQKPATDTEHPCYDADIAAKRVWNEETKIQVRAQVLSWGGEFETQVLEQQALTITSTMDRLSDDWARMRKAVCHDHFTRQTLTKQEYQTRVDCLDRLLSRQRTFVSSLATPQADVSAQLAAIDHEVSTCR